MEHNKNESFDPSKLNESERALLLAWAENVREIQKNPGLSRKEKINALMKLNNKEALVTANKMAIRKVKAGWKRANWAARLAILAGGATLGYAGVAGAGVAAFGGAVGIPLFLLSAAGGAFIGTLIDNLKKSQE